MPHLLIVGAGPGISGATAAHFGADGYDVGLIARPVGASSAPRTAPCRHVRG